MRIKHSNPLHFALDNVLSDLLNLDPHITSTTTGNGNGGLNIEEYNDHFVVQVIAPGYDKRDFSIVLENDMLLVEAKPATHVEPIPGMDAENSTRSNAEHKNALDAEAIPAAKTPGMMGKTIRKDYVANGFKKTFHIDSKKLSAPTAAHYQQGILIITIPKIKKEAIAQKTITVI